MFDLGFNRGHPIQYVSFFMILRISGPTQKTHGSMIDKFSGFSSHGVTCNLIVLWFNNPPSPSHTVDKWASLVEVFFSPLSLFPARFLLFWVHSWKFRRSTLSFSLSFTLFLKSSVCLSADWDCDSDVRFVAVVVGHLIQAAKAFNEQHLKNDICMFKCSPHEHTHTHTNVYHAFLVRAMQMQWSVWNERERSVLVSIAVFLLVRLCVWKCVGVSFGFAFCAGFLVRYSCVCLPALPVLWVAVEV